MNNERKTQKRWRELARARLLFLYLRGITNFGKLIPKFK